MPFKKLLKSLAQEFEAGMQEAAGYPSQQGQQRSGYSSISNYLGAGNNWVAYTQPVQVPQQTTPCPRQEPQAGFQDWVGLGDPRFQNFHMCPTCYHDSIQPTPYANQFVTKQTPPNVAFRCDMSRFWVKNAGLVLLTMNQTRQHDITLLPRVAAITVNEGNCPNEQIQNDHTATPVVSRMWYTIRDPQTGAMPLQNFNICSHCLANMQMMCPAVSRAFVPASQSPFPASCTFVPSSYFSHGYTSELLKQTATCEVMAGMPFGRLDLSILVNFVRSSPAPRPAPSAYTAPSLQPGQAFQSPGPALQPRTGLCPRNATSTTLRCHAMRDLFEFTICEQCYAEVIVPDASKGVSLAQRVDITPSPMPSGFTCQLYSDRMRQIWREAALNDNIQNLTHKVTERRVKERELQMKISQTRHQAQQLREQAIAQEQMARISMDTAAHRAANNMRLAANGIGYQVDGYRVVEPNTVPDFSPFNQLNSQSAMLKFQAAQLEDHIRLAEEEWRRYWE